MTDPIADMLTRIRNANLAYKDEVGLPVVEMQAIASRRSWRARATSSVYDRQARATTSADHDHAQVRPSAGADDHRHHARLEARPPRLRGARRAAARAGRARHRYPVDVAGRHDRPRGSQARASAAKSSRTSGRRTGR